MKSKPRGRPPKQQGSKTEVIRARVSPDEKEEIRSLADRLKMSISELILYAIRKLK